MNLSKQTIFLICLISGILLSIPYQPFGSAWFGFIAWIGWFAIDEQFYSNRTTTRSVTVFWWAYLMCIVWNGASTWWIMNASAAGAALAVLFNPVFMAAAVWGAHVIKRKTNRTIGYISFVALWMAYEWLHLHWDLSWPWLQLGNSFATSHNLVQWYEFTGVLGGTLWLLVINILLFETIRVWKQQQSSRRKLSIAIALCLIIPIICSILLIPTTKPNKQIEVIAIQPNVDPYGTELDLLPPQQLVNRLLGNCEKLITPQTKYVLLPECALPGFMWENSIEQNPTIQALYQWSAAHNNIAIITGATTGLGYNCPKAPTSTARGIENNWYDVFNSAIQIKAGQSIQVYHKSQLVLGVEKMPLAGILPFLKPLAEMLGGSANSLGTQSQRTPFTDGQLSFTPVICYESVYGAFVASYCKTGSQAVFVITNDGWWGNTPGYKQHLSFSRLRAIETRRTIVRSANTGISAMVLPTGEIINPTEYEKTDARLFSVPLYSNITLYARFGDWLGALASIILGLIVIFTIYKIKKR